MGLVFNCTKLRERCAEINENAMSVSGRQLRDPAEVSGMGQPPPPPPQGPRPSAPTVVGSIWPITSFVKR